MNARAIPRPMPLPPPVMNATLPSTSFIVQLQALAPDLYGRIGADRTRLRGEAISPTAATRRGAARRDALRNLCLGEVI